MKTTAIALAVGLVGTPALAGSYLLNDRQLGEIAGGMARFTVTPQVADQAGVAPVTDAMLVNPWGLSQATPATPLWSANNGTGTSTLYDPNTFAKAPLTVTIPGPGGTQGLPTGTTFVGQGPGNFTVSSGAASGPTLFAFATQQGQIAAWNNMVDPTHAVVAVDNSARGDVYTGLTLAGAGSSARLFAADLAHNLVRAYDSNYREVGAFTDPNLPPGYGPFNVQVLNGQLYVAFTKQEGGEEVVGQGNGFVDVFDTNGNLVRRLVSHGQLNAPWGLTIAPANFGKFAGALLVGNFGNGKINAYDPQTGNFIGAVRDGGNKVQIDGLWALRSGPNGSVVFSAGTGDETHGLIGAIAPAAMRAGFGDRERATMAEMHRR